jgi:Tol biopolymer transport system component
VHPEGTILFLRTTGNDLHAYYTANADGTDERQLTQPGEYCCNNRISPDRTQIIVMPGGAPPTPVAGGLLTIDGARFTPLHLNDPTLNLVPQAWSPDGMRIAFEGWDESDPTRSGLYTGTSGNVTDVVRLTSTRGAPHDMPLDYSSDGSMLVFYRAVRAEPDFPIDIGGSLWVVNKDGSDARQLDTPVSGTWTATGAMATDRAYHTATLLTDGKVLVASGAQDGVRGGPFAELYDPISGTWTAAGNMITPTPLLSHTATLLPDGRVLVAGGIGFRIGIGSVDLASAELYDPGSGN